MGQDGGGGGAGRGVQGEEGGEELRSGEGEEGEFGAEDGAGVAGVGGREAEGAGVREAFEARPAGLDGKAAELEDLLRMGMLVGMWILC